MGCGYSKISITGKRGRLKDNSDLGDDSPEDYYIGCSTPEKLRRANGKSSTNDIGKNNGDVNQVSDESLASRRRIANKIKPISGPMRPPINRSDSQMDFFRMLDEKIENGKDFECVSMEDENTRVGSAQVVLPGKNAQLISVAPVSDSSPSAGSTRGRHTLSGKENSRVPNKESDTCNKPGSSHKRVRDLSSIEANDPLDNSTNKATKFGPHASNGAARGIQHADSRPPGGGDGHYVAGVVASPTFNNAAAKLRSSPPRPDSSSSVSTTTSSCAMANEEGGQTHHVQAECYANASASSSRQLSRDDESLSRDRPPPGGVALAQSSQLSLDVDMAADCMTDAAITAAIFQDGGDHWQQNVSLSPVAILSSAIIENEEEETSQPKPKDEQDEVKLCNSNSVANGGLHSHEPGHNPIS